jgi:uncharacterized membrane protein YraQ (UPF0718 family)
LTRIHKALAHPARSRILAKFRGGELCVCQLNAVIGHSRPEAVIPRKVLKPKLVAVHFGVIAVGIVTVGYSFNLLL